MALGKRMVGHLVEHQAAMQAVVILTPAGPSLRSK